MDAASAEWHRMFYAAAKAIHKNLLSYVDTYLHFKYVYKMKRTPIENMVKNRFLFCRIFNNYFNIFVSLNILDSLKVHNFDSISIRIISGAIYISLVFTYSHTSTENSRLNSTNSYRLCPVNFLCHASWTRQKRS